MDGFTHDGGVHRHRWAAPAGQGNDAVLVVIDTSKVVPFGGPAHPTKAASAVPAQPRLLMLKSPMMTGTDVLAVQQQRAHLGVDGIVGPQTTSSLGLPS